MYMTFTALLAPILPFDRVATWMRFASSPHSQDSSTGTNALVFLPHFCSPPTRIMRPGISRVYAQRPPSILSILFEGRCTISLPISHTQYLGTDVDELSHCRRRQQAHGDATPLARRNVLQVTCFSRAHCFSCPLSVVIQALQLLAKHEGHAGMFKGLSINLIKVVSK